MFTFSSGYHVIKPVECTAYAGVVIDKNVTSMVLWDRNKYDRFHSFLKNLISWEKDHYQFLLQQFQNIILYLKINILESTYFGPT